MKKAKAPRVPVLEDAFEVNLTKLMRAAKASGSSTLILDDGSVRTVAILAETRLGVVLGGQHRVVDIVQVKCLKGRSRPLLKCPRAHEGNFQSLYYRNGELACRHCQGLRYQSTVSTVSKQAYLRKTKMEKKITHTNPTRAIARPFRGWRSKYLRLIKKLQKLTIKSYQYMEKSESTDPAWEGSRCCHE